MNLEQLRKLVEATKDLPGSTRILTPGSDHSYRPAKIVQGTALYDEANREWTEDYGEEDTPEAEYGKRLNVLIVE